jgi:hypothetical protein
MGLLSLTFRGPFLFVVPPPVAGAPAPTVTIYAPKCDSHLGSVFFGNGSHPIFGNAQNGSTQKYAVIGVQPNTSRISYQWDLGTTNRSMILSPDSMVPPPPYNPNLASAYFSITVPRPKIFYALNSVNDTEVVTGAAPTGNYPNLLTAFRLYYDWDLTTLIQLQVPANVGPMPWPITPPAGAVPPGAPAGWLPLADSGDIEFQFEGPDMSDPDHQDASSCFDQIAKMAGIPWWLSFDNSGGAGGHLFRTGSDCLALPIVLGLNN